MLIRGASAGEERGVDAVGRHDTSNFRPEVAEQPFHRARNGDELAALAQPPENQLASQIALLSKERLEVAGMAMRQHPLSCQAPQDDKSDLAIKARVAADVHVHQLWPPPEQSPHKTSQRTKRQQQFAEFFILIY